MGQLAQGIGLIDHLAQFTPTKEEIDTGRDTLAVNQISHTSNIFLTFHTHPFLNGAAEFQQPLANLTGGQLVNRSQTAITQVVNIVDLALIVPQTQNILHRTQEVFRTQRHLIQRNIGSEFAIQTESSNLAQTIPVGIIKLFFKKSLRLLRMSGIARTQSCINPHQSFFVAFSFVLRQRRKNQRVPRIYNHFHRVQFTGLYRSHRVAQLGTRVNQYLAALSIDNRADRPHRRFKLFDLDRFGFIEQTDQVFGLAVFFIHRPQKSRRGNLAGLVDPNDHHILFGDGDFDPASALRDNSRTVKNPVAVLAVDPKVHTRATVKLIDDHALGSVDNKFAAANHHGHFTQIDRLLGNIISVLPFEPAVNLQRATIGQTKFPTLFECVAGLFQFISEIFQFHRLIIADNGENLPEQRF